MENSEGLYPWIVAYRPTHIFRVCIKCAYPFNSLRTCYWYNAGSNPENQVEKYFELLGDDWNVARILGGLSSSFAFYLFCYMLSFTCSSQVRGVRYFNIFFMCCVLTTLQGLTFLIFRTDLCADDNCTFGRGAGFSVASMSAFFMAGICFLWTKDYPGDRLIVTEKDGFEKANAAPGTDEEEGTQKKEVFEEDEVFDEEVLPDDEEEIIEEEMVDKEDDVVVEEDDNAETGTHATTQDEANIHTVESALKDAEA